MSSVLTLVVVEIRENRCYIFAILVTHWLANEPEKKTDIMQMVVAHSFLFFFTEANSFYFIGLSWWMDVLKVRKFQNENMELSHCPKYEQKIWKIVPWTLRAEFFKKFCSYFGQCDDFIFSFWNLLTFKGHLNSEWIYAVIDFPK